MSNANQEDPQMSRIAKLKIILEQLELIEEHALTASKMVNDIGISLTTLGEEVNIEMNAQFERMCCDILPPYELLECPPIHDYSHYKPLSSNTSQDAS